MGGTELQHENKQMFFFQPLIQFHTVFSGIGRDLREGEGVGMS